MGALEEEDTWSQVYNLDITHIWVNNQRPIQRLAEQQNVQKKLYQRV